MIVPDTNVWSETINAVQEPRVIDWMNAHWDDLALASIVLAELRYGVGKLVEGRKRTELARQVDRIERLKGRRLLRFGSREAEVYGELMGRMKRAGTPLPLLDGQIAATALAAGASVATRNVDDFVRSGVKVIDPWQTQSPESSKRRSRTSAL